MGRHDGASMTASNFFIVLAAFLASTVEAVEALTIILAVGLTNGWRTSLLGVAAASVALAVVVIALGPALVQVVPLGGLQTVIGVLLLIFGMQWVRKAILRATGRKALHDEALKRYIRGFEQRYRCRPTRPASAGWGQPKPL